jgi:hypothetical protein
MNKETDISEWPCHSEPQDAWCDRDGAGGFMGHTCDTNRSGIGLTRRISTASNGRKAYTVPGMLYGSTRCSFCKATYRESKSKHRVNWLVMQGQHSNREYFFCCSGHHVSFVEQATAEQLCEGCGAGMTGVTNYASTPDRYACCPRCAESIENEDVPLIELIDTIRPNYYKQAGIEVVTIIKAWKLGFNLGNVLKYILRAGLKTSGRLEDLQKANTYLQFELQEEKEKTP